jgi:signal transduction histidine kinase
MHDGIGGQLLGLMMQVRSGEVDRVSVEQGLQASLADLRMIVDAMDSAEEGLATVLSAFEHRAQSQVEAAGMAFRFDQTIDPAVTLGPRPTLQVLRILQEAIANAMRHSKAGTIAVTAKGHDGAVTITIADDGQGLPRPLRRGRGLTSMETRARSLGGTLSVDSGPGGSTLTLVLPVQPPETGP